MRQRRDVVTYKLPAPFVDANRETLDAIDWARAGRVSITLEAGVAEVEAVPGRHGATLVRPATGKSAILIRNFSDEIAMLDPVKYPQPSPESIALVIAARNPAPDKQE